MNKNELTQDSNPHNTEITNLKTTEDADRIVQSRTSSERSSQLSSTQNNKLIGDRSPRIGNEDEDVESSGTSLSSNIDENIWRPSHISLLTANPSMRTSCLSDDGAMMMENFELSYDSQSVGVASTLSIDDNSVASNIYKMTDPQTGKVIDIRASGGNDNILYPKNFSLFPTREKLVEMQMRKSTKKADNNNNKKNDDDSSGDSDESISSKSSLHSLNEQMTSMGSDQQGKSKVGLGNKTLSFRNRFQNAKKKLLGKSHTHIIADKKGMLPPPKNTVPVRSRGKNDKQDFNPLLLIRTLTKAHDGPIWVTSFSRDGEYLATGGADKMLKIWKVAPTDTNIIYNQDDEDEIDAIWTGSSYESTSLNASNDVPSSPPSTVTSRVAALGTEVTLLSSAPIRSYTDHTEDIVDISWSHTNFLLTASLDKSVRLWHPRKKKCLGVYRHGDFVTSVSFHPSDDRYFVSGAMDAYIRLWNITDKDDVVYARSPQKISAVAYTPDEKFVAAGLFDGKVIFYSIDNFVKLKFSTIVETKNRRQKFGRKVTGLTFVNDLSADKISSESRLKRITMKTFRTKKPKKKEKLLVTTNDSRLRLIGLDDFCLLRKYKAKRFSNTTLQMRAHCSETGEYIICGSELHSCIIWNTATKWNPLNVNVTGLQMHDKVKANESFEATNANPPIVTDANFVPSCSLKKAILYSGLFPSVKHLDNVDHDFSSSAIMTCDYEGTIRLFLRRCCLDDICQFTGPNVDSEEGNLEVEHRSNNLFDDATAGYAL